ncbi:MAG TPA: DUF2911 domain-containing protein [Cyclobacteriaceae bacterium]|nr:DUF2911 domain-containing protein [Cyclobacteriaceae bacterium]
MKNYTIQKSGFLGICVMLIYTIACGQERASPAKTAEGTVNDAKITINYSSPAVKGRTIWGDLVEYGKVWRAGANEATTFETSKDIRIEGKTLPAGKYSFYIIPNDKEGTFIFNSQTGQWGTQYDEGKDVIRIPVQFEEINPSEERLTYNVTPTGFEIRWADRMAKVKIE